MSVEIVMRWLWRGHDHGSGWGEWDHAADVDDVDDNDDFDYHYDQQSLVIRSLAENIVNRNIQTLNNLNKTNDSASWSSMSNRMQINDA